MLDKKKSLFRDDETIRAIAVEKTKRAHALPPGPERSKLLKEANSYKILAEAKNWFSGELRPPQ
jgi:hypothetical protein